MGQLSQAWRHADWEAIGRRLLEAAAAELAEAARHRTQAAPDAIGTEVRHTTAARITLATPDLVAQELGAPGRPPRSILTPRPEDLAAARARMIRILQGDEA